ncbi:MAG: tetratricopeptide repeat protein, partial [Bacteroidetes bacterium]
MLIQRAILTWWPTLAYKSVPPITIQLPPNLAAADKLPTPRGSLAGANVVLVTLDTTRADRLGCYGNQHIRTPNLDDLAARGVLFKHALAPNPSTLPSHASILTGLYPFHHGARANGIFQLADKQTTLAELLSQAGYATAAFLSATVLDSRYGLAQGFGHYDDDMSEGRELLWLGGLERTGDKTTDHALKWLRGNADQKFFMWVHLYDPHSPTTPPEPYASEYAELPYDGEIAFVDEQVGRLLFELDKLGLTDNTLVVVVGDHGEGLGQHKEWSHGFMLYDATLQVPMIMACGSRMKGVHIDQTVSSADVTPTVLSLLGLDVPNGLDGVDLASSVPSERALYFDNLEGLSEWGLAPLLGVYMAPFKYIWGPQPELYDLSTDPFETRDVIQTQAQTATRLKTQLQSFFGQDLAAAAFAAPTQQLSSDELHKLQALGYAGAGLGNQPPTTPLPDPKTHMDLVLRVEMALMRGDQGSPADAAAALEKLAAKHPDVLAVYRNLGDVYRQMGEYEKARGAYEQCRKLRPDLP